MGQLYNEYMYKNTKVRSAMLEVFAKNPIPLSIAELLLKLKKMNIVPNKTTVYREIEFLKSLGLISEVDFGEGKKRYETRGKHHHHIICINCKTIKDISLEADLDLFNAKIAKTAGFEPVGHSLEFFGLCSSCQQT